MENVEHPALEPTPTSQKKRVQFATVPQAAADGRGKPLEAGEPGAGSTSRATFSPARINPLFRQSSQESWTIEAQRSDKMEDDTSSAPSAGELGSPLPFTPASATTPASAGYLESARKVEDLRGRLESLEMALKEMEEKAQAHLDKSLQQQVLATAAKIVQRRFMEDKELDQKLQKQILRTALKVVKRAEGAVQATQAPPAAAPAEQEASNPTRKLEFEQGEGAGEGNIQQYVAYIENSMGEVVRRLEKKVDLVASLVDQNVLELLEARLASGVVRLEARLDQMEAAQRQQPPAGAAAAEPSQALLERVSAMEAAMVEQSRAMTDLLAALTTQGQVASQQAASAALQALQSTAAALPSADVAPAVQREAPKQEAAAPSAVGHASSGPEGASDAQPQSDSSDEELERPQPPQQLIQRRVVAPLATKSAAAKRDGADSDIAEATVVSARPALPRLKTTHAAGTAQQIAIATAREQLARQAQRAHEEAEQDSPVLAMLYVFGWILLILLGMAAMLVGTVATLVKSGRLTEADLEFLWQQGPAK